MNTERGRKIERRDIERGTRERTRIRKKIWIRKKTEML
jgi:hypothetical protein